MQRMSKKILKSRFGYLKSFRYIYRVTIMFGPPRGTSSTYFATFASSQRCVALAKASYNDPITRRHKSTHRSICSLLRIRMTLVLALLSQLSGPRTLYEEAAARGFLPQV